MNRVSERVVHCKKSPYDIYIGRPSKWGNPYSHLSGTLAEYKVSSREEAIENLGERYWAAGVNLKPVMEMYWYNFLKEGYGLVR
jgi:hypothetical protein